MSQLNNYLYLIWKDPQMRRNFTVGKLSRDTSYTFEYLADAHKAEEYGWTKLEAFPAYQVYTSENLFPVFSSRLPDRKRRDIQKILDKYGLASFDEFELLRKSGARLPIDTYEFIDPIFPDDETIQRDFFVMGIRHHAPCEGTDCTRLPNVKQGDLLVLTEEPENANDPLAIRVFTQQGDHLGYVPRYYNQSILERLKKGVSYSCRVLDIHPSENCSECIKVRLNMPRHTTAE